MNRTLLVSIHGWIAALLVAVLVALSFAMPAQTVGMSTGSRTFLLASGWITLATFLAAYGYVLRKYAHKLGYSPEFRMRMPRAAIERAEGRIEEIRYAMALGTLTGANEILEKARRVLREEKCQRVLRVHLEGQGNATALVTSRTEPLGRMARWMHAHVYYGFAAGILTLVHGGARYHSAMGIALNGLTMLVVVTGVIGLVLWLYGPAWLTRLEHDLTTEEVFVLSRHYERRVADALSGIQAQDPAFAAALRDASGDKVPVLRAQLSNLMQESGAAETDADMRARDIMALCGQRLRLRAELARLSRARFAMNAWRLVHIPSSIVLLAVIIVHVASVWLY
jgi:hypothetical protein